MRSDRILALVRKQFTAAEIAAKLNTTREHVYEVINQNSLAFPPNPVAPPALPFKPYRGKLPYIGSGDHRLVPVESDAWDADPFIRKVQNWRRAREAAQMARRA